MCVFDFDLFLFFFFNDTATTEIYTLSLHDRSSDLGQGARAEGQVADEGARGHQQRVPVRPRGRDLLRGHDAVGAGAVLDRKSTRLNSSHANISYAVFCLKKKKKL